MEKWICSCGQENTSKFCSACGNKKPENEPVLDASTTQVETAPIEPVNTPLLKKWGSSVLMLFFAILTSVYALLDVITLFFNFQNASAIIGSLVAILVAALVCAGAWKVYVNAKNADVPMQSGGLKLMRGCLIFYEVIVTLLLAVMILMFLMLVATASVITENSGEIANMLEQAGVDPAILDSIINLGTTVFIVLLIVVIAAFVVAIIAFSAIKKDMRDMINMANNPTAFGNPGLKGTVFMFIFAVVSFASFILNIVMFSGIMSVLSSLVQTAMFAVGGVLMLKFNKTRLELNK